FLPRGVTVLERVPCEANDTLVEELEEFADCVRGKGRPEMDGEKALSSLAVIRAGVRSAREGRRVTLDEVLASPEE
ncbi:MAG: Gfo/Idh/MocA family oxidoreductase, partial [Nitrospinota bacterium]